MARTDTADGRLGSRGISAFIVTPDLPGFHVGKKEVKMGLRVSPSVKLKFDALRVPADNVLGDEGQGFIYAMRSLDNGRLGIAAQAIGIARASLEASLDYAAERKQFGQPIADFQAIQFKLADMGSRIAAARALLHATAESKDRGESTTMHGSMVKLLASETAMWAANQAVQIFGGDGDVKDDPPGEPFREPKVTGAFPGTSPIKQHLVVSRAQFYTRSPR